MCNISVSLFSFFFVCLFFVLSTWLPLLVELVEGRMSMASRGCGAMEQGRCVSLGGQLQPSWTCLFPRAFPAAHRIGFHCLLFFALWNSTPMKLVQKTPKLLVCLKCVWRQVSRKWSFHRVDVFQESFSPNCFIPQARSRSVTGVAVALPRCQLFYFSWGL